jgi:hypothetical protein
LITNASKEASFSHSSVFIKFYVGVFSAISASKIKALSRMNKIGPLVNGKSYLKSVPSTSPVWRSLFGSLPPLIAILASSYANFSISSASLSGKKSSSRA